MKLVLLYTLVLAVAISSTSPVSLLEKRRFGQENPPVLNDIRALGRLPGAPSNGRFDQIAGGFISNILAAANACDRYAFIDEIITNSKANGNPKEGIVVAQKLAAVEKNFNPFLTDGKGRPAFCTDPSLPKSDEVRCIVPVIDPGVKGADDFNKKANDRLQQVMSGQLKPESCAGKSVAQQAVDLGLTDCLGCDGLTANGNANATGNAGNNNNNTGNNNNNTGNNNNSGNTNTGNNKNSGNTNTVAPGNDKKVVADNKQDNNKNNNNMNKNGNDKTSNNVDGVRNKKGEVSNVDANKCLNGNATVNKNKAKKNKKAKKGKGKMNGKKDGKNANEKEGQVNNAKKEAPVKADDNLNKFKGALGGAPPIKVVNVGGARPFQVLLANGKLNGDFINSGAAFGRACDVQHNDCARVANSDAGRQQKLTVGDCDKQNDECHKANAK